MHSVLLAHGGRRRSDEEVEADPFIYPWLHAAYTPGTRQVHARNTLEERWAR